MVHNMRLLLLNDLLKDLLDGTRSVDRAAVGLVADQDEDSGCDGEDRHNNIHAGKAEFEQCDQPGQKEPDAQQQHADTFSDSHFCHRFLLLTGTGDGRRACDPCYPSGWIRIV